MATCGDGITVAGKVLLWYGILLRYPPTMYVYVCSYSGKVLMFPAWAPKHSCGGPLNLYAAAPYLYNLPRGLGYHGCGGGGWLPVGMVLLL